MALWVLLLVSLASVHCTCATTSYPMLLDLRGRVIGCSSTLQCESPVAIVDGNDSTSWNAPQVNSEDIASVTLNLGKVQCIMCYMYIYIYIFFFFFFSILFIFLLLQEYTITNLYLQLPSIPSPISQLTMQHSTDGDVFQSTRGSLFLDHGTCPRGLCTVMGQDVPVCMSVCACIHCTCVCVCVCVCVCCHIVSTMLSQFLYIVGVYTNLQLFM